MNLITAYFRELTKAIGDGWDRFWFTPSDPATLCAIRIPAGLMLLYTHLVWSIDFMGFFGSDGRLSPSFARGFHQRFESGTDFAWSHFFWIESPAVLWTLHVLALIIFAMLALGLCTRVVAVLALLVTLSYVHRVPGALFGLDQINVMLALYLAIGPSGSRYSLDAIWARRRNKQNADDVPPSTMANVAIRLLQLHLCVIYLFAGFGKLLGASWWDGTAMWLALANYEYQTIDMTWMGRWPFLINAITQLSLLWEVTYTALIWPKWTRPIVLGLAIPVHLGIAFCMGMVTFGILMVVANIAFVSPELIKSILRTQSKTHVES